MAQKPNGPRKPATKFPHLRKQMQKNQLPQSSATSKLGQSTKFGPAPHGRPKPP